MLRMIKIGLVERAALAFVDRAGIAVPEPVEFLRVERDRPGCKRFDPVRLMMSPSNCTEDGNSSVPASAG